MKKEYFFLIIMLIFISFNISVLAEDTFSIASAFGVKELKSLELLINATDSLTADTNLTTYFNINETIFTDGISKVVNMKVRSVIDKTSAQPYTLNMYVNDSTCNYSGFDTSLGVGQYVAYFDCTSLFTNSTNTTYKFDFNINKNAGNIYILFMPTYINNPSFNYSDMSEAIWNYTNRNLTYYPNNTDIILNNITSQLNNIFNNFTTEFSLIPYNVWNYTTRTLTSIENLDFTLDVNRTNITLDISDKAIIKIVETFCFNYPRICNKPWYS